MLSIDTTKAHFLGTYQTIQKDIYHRQNEDNMHHNHNVKYRVQLLPFSSINKEKYHSESPPLYYSTYMPHQWPVGLVLRHVMGS